MNLTRIITLIGIAATNDVAQEAVLRGTDAGKVVIVGDLDGSSLIKSVRHAPDVEPMPTDSE